MNLYPAVAYLRHFLIARSTAGHGVHSPYVYDFLTRVVKGKPDVNIVSHVESLRHEMLADRRCIRVTDLGAGSVTGAGRERRVAEIAGTAAVPSREAGLLARMVAASTGSAARSDASTGSASQEAGSAPGGTGHVDERSEAIPRSGRVWSKEQGARSMEKGIILELGTSLGISTLALALAAPQRRVVTVEGCPALADIARENLMRHGASNAEVMTSEFSNALESLRMDGQNVSFAFIDGNHKGWALTQYVSMIAAMGEEMTIAADDIHLTKEMFMAWKQVEASGIAPAAMETLRLGILFLKQSITPGRYRIRY